MAARKKERSAHLGGTLEEYVQRRRQRSPEFGVEFDRLQLARRVRELREKREMTQSELARRVGTAQPNIARLESGRVVPRLDLLARVARALGAELQVRFHERRVSG